MATVNLQCPKCLGTGLVGAVTESICPQCSGKGTVTADDSQTLATVNTTVGTGTNNKLVVTSALAVPGAALKVAARGRT